MTNGVSALDTVVITSSDPADHVSATAPDLTHPGKYTAKISSRDPGQSTITATTTLSNATATAVLTKYGNASGISVSLNPSVVRADRASSSTVTAIVADAKGDPVPSDAVVFTSSDPGEQLSATTAHGDGTYTATITSSTRAGSATITAIDTSVTPNLSASASLTQSAGSPTQVSVQLVPNSIVANATGTTRAVATVTDANGNPIKGDTIVFSSSDPAMRAGTTTNNGDGTYSATLTSSNTPGEVTITATDTSVTPNLRASATLTQYAVPVQFIPTVGSFMRWTFHFTPSYTTVLHFEVIHPPPGGNIVLTCTGKGCPFRTRAMQVNSGSCHTTAPYNCGGHLWLRSRFRNHRLHAGSRITVTILLPHWVGKYYSFTIRARQGPRIKIECTAPGQTRPGVGC